MHTHPPSRSSAEYGRGSLALSGSGHASHDLSKPQKKKKGRRTVGSKQHKPCILNPFFVSVASLSVPLISLPGRARGCSNQPWRRALQFRQAWYPECRDLAKPLRSWSPARAKPASVVVRSSRSPRDGVVAACSLLRTRRYTSYSTC